MALSHIEREYGDGAVRGHIERGIIDAECERAVEEFKARLLADSTIDRASHQLGVTQRAVAKTVQAVIEAAEEAH